MPSWRRPALRLPAIGAAATLALLALGAFLFASSGIYNIAAREPHWAVTRWLLEYGLTRAVDTHSRFGEPPPAPLWHEGADAVRLGAAHFHGGCAFCHGAPGQPRGPIPSSMLPKPPNLSHAAGKWEAEELHWIVHSGLKYTGMPAWPAGQRWDEVWPVVAFLQRLPELDAQQYRALAVGEQDGHQPPGKGLAALPDCARCHGDAERLPASRLVPRLDILSREVIETALRHYAEGRRPSGVMQPLAARLDEPEIAALADYYAAADPIAPAAAAGMSPELPPERLESGRQIATGGLRESGLPPCEACHGEGRHQSFPRLAGQSAPYIAGQLRLWQRGGRTGTAAGRLMAVVAQRLSPEQVEEVAAFYASLPDQGGAR